MTKGIAVFGSVLVATGVFLALFLRPRPMAHEELPAPTTIPPALVHVLKVKMGRHDVQMKALLTRVVLLDDDGVARAAGEIFDEPALAVPLTGDELNGLLPPRFFTLQDELRKHAKQLVIASDRHDRTAVAEEFAALSKTCIGCHEVYLHGNGPSVSTQSGTR